MKRWKLGWLILLFATWSHAEDAAVQKFFDQSGVPAHPSLEPLCGPERVSGAGGEHIEWESFSSSLEPGKLVDFYKNSLGEKVFTPTEHGGSFLLAEIQLHRKVSLDILTLGEQLPGRCETTTPTAAKSLIVLSVMLAP